MDDTKTSVNEKQIESVKRLLLSPDLNLDELEDETRAAMNEIRKVFNIKDC